MSDPLWTTSYAQIHRPNARGVARHAALSTLAAAAMASGKVSQQLRRPRVHFVYLHHVFEDEIASFRTIVETLLRHMTPLTYTDAVERTIHGPIDRPYVCFSFDDGFKNNLAAAVVLEASGVKGCFFVCPEIVAQTSHDAIVDFSRRKLHLPPMQFLNWDDIESLHARGHEIGNHTLSHEDLALSMTPVHEQVERSLHLLRLRFADVRHFAWPYGHFKAINGFVRDMVFNAGHVSCASAQRGAHVEPAGDARRLCIRRDHLIAAWPVAHVLYLLARSARRATAADNLWPDDLL